MIPLFLALAAEYVDSALGMGYGTILSPLLVMMGYDVRQVVPSILATELVTGLLSGLLHWRVGNTRLGRRSMMMLGLLGGVTIIGTTIGALVMINLPPWYTKLYIGLLVLAMGMLMLLRGRARQFSWTGIAGISFLAAFNKAISGGGYGPVVCSGQVLNGVEIKQAIGLTGLAESLTCAVALVVYITGIGHLDLGLVPSLLVGSILGVPLAVVTVKHTQPGRLQKVVALGMVALSFFMLKSIL